MPPKLPLLVAAAVLLAGCATSQTARIGTDVLAAGAGGVIADKLSNGNPYWTLAGGVAALGAAEWAHGAASSDEQKQLALAYDRGKAQNAQATYDAIQNVQKKRPPSTRLRHSLCRHSHRRAKANDQRRQDRRID